MPTNIQNKYNELNEPSKAKLRTAFTNQFEFSRDTFYKKIAGETPMKNIERKFFCTWFNSEMEILFPLYESVNK